LPGEFAVVVGAGIGVGLAIDCGLNLTLAVANAHRMPDREWLRRARIIGRYVLGRQAHNDRTVTLWVAEPCDIGHIQVTALRSPTFSCVEDISLNG
jgi:hypothetical protein